MSGLGRQFETKPTIGGLYTVVVPAAPQISWPPGCARCGKPGPQRRHLLRVHPIAAGMPLAGPRHLEVPMCTGCRWRVGPKIGLLLWLGSSVAALMTGTGKARHGIGPFFHWRWLWVLSLLLLPIGFVVAFRSRPAVDIAGDGKVLRISFPSRVFADSFAALHARRIEPPTEPPPEPAAEHEPIVDEHDAMI